MSEYLARQVLQFAFYSFLGWLLEFFYRSLTLRRIVNPGFLHGPFVPVYALGAAFIIILNEVLRYEPPFVHVVTYALVLTTFEYVVGVVIERVLHIRLWDYSDNRLNLHGRVCASFSLVWGIIAFVFVRLIHPVFLTWLVFADKKIISVAASTFVVYLGLDLAASIGSLKDFRSAVTRLYRSYLKLSDIEIDGILVKIKRLREAFPYLNRQLFQKLNKILRRRVEAILKGSYVGLLRELHGKRHLGDEYLTLVEDILAHPEFRRLKGFFHHNSSIYEHSRRVSYLSYRLCKQLKLDYRSAARGGLLHDFFLYDWRDHDSPDLARNKFHGIHHPQIALANAETYFVLNEVERDCIAKHMWPLTMTPPRFKESFVVSLVDKYLASRELLNHIYK